LKTQFNELKIQYEGKIEELSRHLEEETILKHKYDNLMKERNDLEKNYEECQQRTKRIETQVVYLMKNLTEAAFHFDTVRSNLIQCQKMGSQLIMHMDQYIQSILEKMKETGRNKLHDACEEFSKKYQAFDILFDTLFNENQNKLDKKMKDELQLCLTHVQQIRDEMFQTLSCHSSEYLQTLKGSLASMLTDYTNKTTCHLDSLNKYMNSTFDNVDMFLTNMCGSIDGFHKQLYNSWTEYRTKTFHGIQEHEKILSTANNTIICQLKDVRDKNDDMYSVHQQIVKDQRDLLEKELSQFVKQIEATSQNILSLYDSQCAEKQKRLDNLQHGVKTNISCVEKMLKTTKTVEEFLESTSQYVDTETKQWMKQANYFFDKTVTDFNSTKGSVEENQKIAKNHYNILREEMDHIQTTTYPNIVEKTMESLQNQITLLKNQTCALHDQINTLETARVSSFSTLLQEQKQAFQSTREQEIHLRTCWSEKNSEMYTTICDSTREYHQNSKNFHDQAKDIFQINESLNVKDSFCLKNVLDALPFQEDGTDETNDTNPCLLFSNGKNHF
jgi:chromosome segregation ATPase